MDLRRMVMKNIYATQEPSCGNLWCIAIDGWYVRQNNSNLTFTTKEETETYIEKVYGKQSDMIIN